MLVIFDFDGTLADTWDIFAEELLAAADRYGMARLDLSEMEKLRRLQTADIFKTLGVSRWRLPFLVAHLRRRAAERVHEARLFPGMPDIVRSLAAAGHTLAIASSNAEPTIRAVLGPDLARCFRYFACSSSVFGKAGKFRKLCREAGAPASTAVTVGDETRDLDAADKAGIRGIAVAWGYNDPELLGRLAPHRTARFPSELLEMLTALSDPERT